MKTNSRLQCTSLWGWTKIFLIAAAVMLLTGCDSNPKRRALLADATVMTDPSGNEWLVQHVGGDNYHLTLIPKRP